MDLLLNIIYILFCIVLFMWLARIYVVYKSPSTLFYKILEENKIMLKPSYREKICSQLNKKYFKYSIKDMFNITKTGLEYESNFNIKGKIEYYLKTELYSSEEFQKNKITSQEITKKENDHRLKYYYLFVIILSLAGTLSNGYDIIQYGLSLSNFLGLMIGLLALLVFSVLLCGKKEKYN